MKVPLSIQRAQLLAALQVALGPIAPTLSPRPLHDLYEAYLFGAIIACARSASYGVAFETVTGVSAPGLTLRTSPGQLASTAQPYTHAVINHGPHEWEVHLGVYVRGSSKVEHECDVVAIARRAAQRARHERRSPDRRYAWLVIEAKYLLTRLPLGVGRGFMGLGDDLKTTTQLVTNIGSDAVRRLLVGHRRPHFRDVTPGSPTDGRWRSHVEEFWDAAIHR